MDGQAIFHLSLFNEFSPPIWNMPVFTPSRRSPLWIPSILKKFSLSNWFLLRTTIPIFFLHSVCFLSSTQHKDRSGWGYQWVTACRRHFSISTLLDLSWAFDTVDHHVLQESVGFSDLSDWPVSVSFSGPPRVYSGSPLIYYTHATPVKIITSSNVIAMGMIPNCMSH